MAFARATRIFDNHPPSSGQIHERAAVADSASLGADVTIDAVGSAGSITTSLETTRPRGRIVMMGIPGTMSIDLTSLWHREIEIVGSYTYGTEVLGDGSVSTSYDLAFTLVRENKLERLVTATYPLDRYNDAIRHAAEAGPKGAIKVAFDMRDEKRR